MAAPTFPASADLVEGTGTRAFAAVTTAAGDYVVVECIGEDGAAANIVNLTPSATGLTFTKRTDVGAASHVRVQQWTAPDSAGGSRTVTITPSASATSHWRARLTVVRGSNGPGTGTGTALTAQTVSVTRQGANSAMHMAVGDWSTGAVGSPAWTPGGATIVSQQGIGATYIVGRWDDSGATATAGHGISTPTYTTPSVAVLEMLGTTATTINGTAALAGAGTLAGTATVIVPAVASLAGAGTLTASSGSTVAGTASLAAAATLSAATSVVTPAAASLAGAGSLTAAVSVIVPAAASLTGTGALSASNGATSSATATLAAGGALTVTPTVLARGAASLVGAGALTVALGGLPGSLVPTTAAARLVSTSTNARIAPASTSGRVSLASTSARLNSTTSGGVA